VSSAAAKEVSLLIHSGWRLIALETFEEDRALRLLDRVATQCSRRMQRWSVSAGLDGGKTGAGSLSSGIEAMRQIDGPTLFVLLDAHHELENPFAVRQLRDWLPELQKKKQCAVLLGPSFEAPTELTRELGRVTLPLPRARDLEGLFTRELGEQAGESSAEVLDAVVKASLGLTAREAVRVLRKTCTLSGGLSQETARYIVGEKRQALRRTAALSFHEPTAGLDSVGGLDELKRWLRERHRAFGKEAQDFGLPMPRGLLLLGVQGCGKSLSAKAVALEWRFPLLRLDMAQVFSGGSQTPEAAIREATTVAESIAPAVLWIDEIEKGFSASSDSARASRVFGAFLTWLAEKTSPVFVVATANDVTSLPPELLRRGRFDELFFVDLPTLQERIEILAIHLRRHGRDPLLFALDRIAQEAERLSGAELEQVVGSGLYSAFAEGRDLSEADLLSAVNETVPLYETYEDQIKELRDWARGRTRMASMDASMADLFA
jgi:AAA+ superfamily predicted ATPase